VIHAQLLAQLVHNSEAQYNGMGSMYTNCAKIIFLAFSLCYLLDLAESAFMGLLRIDIFGCGRF
jgi:hypothetical protein